MKYSNVEWTIGQLMDLINCNRINLRPPYQRNFIWSPRSEVINRVTPQRISITQFLYIKERG